MTNSSREEVLRNQIFLSLLCFSSPNKNINYIMPRSPSPTPRLPRRPFIEDSPQRFRDRDPRDDYRYRGEPSRYRGPAGFDRDRRDLRDRDWRDRDVERDYDRGPRFGGRQSWYARDRDAERMRERDDRDRIRSPLPARPGIPLIDRDQRTREPIEGSTKARSEGTPEEGQITSPVAAPPTISGLPPRPRSPPRSPPRRRSRSPPPFRRFEREPWRDRERDRDRDRFYRRRSPSPYSPIRRRRSPSVSSASTPSRSSRFSPIKRGISPAERSRRTRSPMSEKPQHLTSPEPMSPVDQSRPLSRASASGPTRPQTPSLLPPTLSALQQPAPPTLSHTQPLSTPSVSTFPKRPPPTGPRSERLGLVPPTGPRALAHLYGGRPAAPRVSYTTPIAGLSGTNPTPTATVKNDSHASTTPETPSATLQAHAPPTGPSSGRLSWSERKNVLSQPHPTASEQTSSFNPYAPVPSHNGQTAHRRDDSSPPAPAPQSSSSVSTTPLPRILTPAAEELPNVEESVIAEEELAERKAKEEKTRILAELPPVLIGFGGAAWETELASHMHHYTSLVQNTLRLQAAQRLAAASLADAEAERVAVMERSKICDEQLMSGTLGVGIIGGI